MIPRLQSYLSGRDDTPTGHLRSALRRTLLMSGAILLLSATPALACPADNGPAPANIKNDFCGAWNAAGDANLGSPLNDAHRWASGWIRDFNGGAWSRGGIMEGDGEGWAFIVAEPWWDTFVGSGGAPGPLGYPTGSHVFGGHLHQGPNANTYMTFQGGVINHWAGGTFETHGAILTKWNSVGNVSGALGRPLSNEADTLATPDGVVGRYSRFEGGVIDYNPRINGAFIVYGGILNKYTNLGYSSSPLGLPTSDRQTNPVRGNEYQVFDGGVINQYNGNAYETHGAILAKWNSLGGVNGPVGLPTSDEGEALPTPDGVVGRYSKFEGGVIDYNPRINGAFLVYGGILNKYASLNYSASPLGLPTSDRQTNPGRGNEYQVFDGGVINQYGGNAYETHGAILAKWNELGGVNGPVGLPTSDEGATLTTPDGVVGRYSKFEGGVIDYNPRINGAFLVYGGILNKYASLNYSASPLGLPVSDRQHNDQRGNDYQVFDGGVINQYGGNAYETHGAILAKWNALGGANGPVGLPTSDEGQTARVNGRYELFQGGDIIYNPRINGAFLVYGGILNKYAALGYSNHPLGLPTSDRKAGPRGNEYQVFDGGVINQYGGNAYETHGAILDRWNHAGGVTGSLGLPISDESNTARSPFGSVGRYSRFQHGVIDYNPYLDKAIVLYGAIGDKYASIGYAASYLGLPTSEEYDYQGGKRQNFEGGFIDYHNGVTRTDHELNGGAHGPPAAVPSRYVFRVIGDSVSAGFGIGDDEPTIVTCGTSMPTRSCDHPYSAYGATAALLLGRGFGGQTRVDYQNLAESGSTPHDWFSGGLRPDLNRVISDHPNAIALTLGANDLLKDYMCDLSSSCAAQTTVGTEGSMITVLSYLRDHTSAQIYLLLYYHLDIDAGRAIDALNGALRRAASRVGPRVTVVDGPSFVGHGCLRHSGGLWMLGYTRDLCLHPNSDGLYQLGTAVGHAMLATAPVGSGSFRASATRHGLLTLDRRRKRQPVGTLSCAAACSTRVTAWLSPAGGDALAASKRSSRPAAVQLPPSLVHASRGKTARVRIQMPTAAWHRLGRKGFGWLTLRFTARSQHKPGSSVWTSRVRTR